uniref:Elongation factor P n=1 Tax=Lygus hesperus TaxID=30085 RepID=A0A0A9W1K3_LYGHE
MNIWIWTCHVLFFKVAFAAECLSPNVRTVLWQNSDLYRSCWNDRDIAVLYARRLFQLILPTRVPSRMTHLVAHFKMCLEVVRDLATTKETHAMMVRPMADVIGGYLQSFAVPIGNQEYYEGNLTYSTASQMNELLKGIKKILSTDGGKWTQPIRVLPSNEICPYQVIPPTPIENHCGELISSVDLRHKCKSEKELGRVSAKVPLPFLDNSHKPKSIAVPFRTKTLYSLYDKDSSNILIRYYTAASHCYTTHCGAQEGVTPEQHEFDRSFHDWLMKSIVPHLHDGNWYPAFGGVYRILKHMTHEGLAFPDHEDAGQLVIQGRCLHQEVMAKTSWFFVTCIFGFLSCSGSWYA